MREAQGSRGLGDVYKRRPRGFRVAGRSSEIRQIAGVDGVRVAELAPGPGREAGLMEGDVIMALDRQTLNSTEEFAEIANGPGSYTHLPLPTQRLCSIADGALSLST